MNQKTAWIVIVVVIALGVWFAMSRKTVNAPAENVGTNPSASPTSDNTTSNGIGVNGNVSVTAGSVKNFTVTGANYSFTPSNLTVKKGDTVNITFKNSNGFHDLHIDEFSVATAKIAGGEQQTITFVADKTGSFQYYCAVGNHRAMGMWGTLTVTE